MTWPGLQMANVAIEISDEEETASSVDSRGDARPTIKKSLGKRKLSFDFEEKVAWTDDDGDGDDDDTLQRRRATKRQATAKAKVRHADGNDDQEDDDEPSETHIPDYLQTRRTRFDRDRAILKTAGLKLPPDYSDIYFSDDDGRSKLEERPKFDESSGIKPSRPYKDVELEFSAGIIPASIAQYLRDYQIAGVKFLHQRFVYQRGCILGDDMGLGKTVQVAAFLAAAFGKTGDERDAKRMRKVRRAGDGDNWYPKVLIVCPGSLIQNWKNELNRWGWWHVDLYHGAGKEDVLHAARAGRIEIMITTYVTYKNSREAVNEVEWDCVVADECHLMKDRRSETTRAMEQVNSLCRIGLTGTAIQNKYEELWTLLNWTNPGHFGTLAEWHKAITLPLTVGQSHDATQAQLRMARITAKKLVENLLPEFFLRRMKTLIADQLPKKSDKVVFCPLTDIQREAYENFLEGSQVSLINSISDPCDCGSGRKKGWCCHKTLDDTGKSWMSLVFPTIMTLQKLANHLTLLIPSSADPNDKQSAELNALRTCVPDRWEDLYRNRDSMLNLANPEFCGKWKILRKLLTFWHDHADDSTGGGGGNKVLIFSHSVRLLRILQHLFHNTHYNVSFLDGSLSYEDRQRAVDDFNTDPAQFVFLISTKAGGVGLNITSANKVVIFDPHWNPAYDLQAQDRAYRIGQVRDVDVFRLVSAGTIEEIVYARQIYKQQQANIGYSASSERRYFKGVQQDSSRKGEIFGLGNLLCYHADQVVLREIVNKTNVAEARAGVALAEVDVEGIGKGDGEGELEFIKQEEGGEEEGEDGSGGVSQLAKLLVAENQEEVIKAAAASGNGNNRPPKSDAIAAILASAGVEYTHENSEVIGTSKVEAQLSRRAEANGSQDLRAAGGVDRALFEDDGAGGGSLRMHYKFRPPVDVMRRQFCSMAKEFGFQNATDFALVVESWTQEQRRNCLDTFYKIREVKLLEKELEGLKEEKKEEGEDVDVKKVLKSEPEPEPERIGMGSELGRSNDVSDKKMEDAEDVRDVDIKKEKEDSSAPSRPLGVVTAKMGQVGSRKIPTIFLDDDEDDEDDEL
ncbi:P-loop containing nucleoside triphosphate hydrolase protein [Bombardia bombarda]|uniref:P-loop containing nucleoside triphosphate hydrolase protein n=1 Tax=Bombardia bombarda TaxID=252184 RepID=A0AA39XMN4_9PEZI|nr:P-loop containing nucleoside triphosphate hydrolase protein [Bombardia bombarda]